MFEPTQRDVDHDLEASMDLFKRAQVGEVAAVRPRRPENLLLVLDGSNQDETAAIFARQLRDRFGCGLTVMDARERVESNELAEQAAKMLGATAVPKSKGDSFQQILDATAESKCDLLIVPCPYGRELESVGPDSTGTVIDVLLARSPVPLLVVREPFVPADDLFHRVLVILLGENEAAPLAAEWAAGLVALSGRFELVLVIEEEFYENVRELIRAIDPTLDVSPDTLAHALERIQMRLHSSLQKAAAAEGFQYKMHVHRAGEPEVAATDAASRRSLHVLPLERGDHASRGYVHDHVRRTFNPVMIVPVGCE